MAWLDSDVLWRAWELLGSLPENVFSSSQDPVGEQGAAGWVGREDGAGTAAGRAGCPCTGLLRDEMQLLGVSCNGVSFYLKMTKPLIRIFFLHLALEKKN